MCRCEMLRSETECSLGSSSGLWCAQRKRRWYRRPRTEPKAGKHEARPRRPSSAEDGRRFRMPRTRKSGASSITLLPITRLTYLLTYITTTNMSNRSLHSAPQGRHEGRPETHCTQDPFSPSPVNHCAPARDVLGPAPTRGAASSRRCRGHPLPCFLR